jgi:hypothetical protein
MEAIGTKKVCVPSNDVCIFTNSMQSWPGDLKLSPTNIGNILFGLRSTPRSPEVYALLEVLIPKIKACSKRFDAEAVRKSMCGIQGLCVSSESRQLLEALRPKVEQCSKLMAQDIANAVYGMRFLVEGDFPEVRKMMQALVDKIRQCPDEMTADDLAYSIYGLNISGSLQEVHEVLKLLAPKIQDCRGFEPVQIGMVLYGLQRMGDTEASRQAAAALVSHIEQCEKDFLSRDVARSLRGLRGLGPDGVQSICAALLPKIRRCGKKMCSADLSDVLDSISRIRWKDTEGPGELLAVLLPVVLRLKGELGSKAALQAIKWLDSLGELGDVQEMRAALG